MKPYMMQGDLETQLVGFSENGSEQLVGGEVYQ